MQFKIGNTVVAGLDRCIVSSGNSFRTVLRNEKDLNEKDLIRVNKLGSVLPGSGHDSFLNGITVIADFTAPLYWWKQAQRYHWFEFVSSMSTMHCVTKFNVKDRCVEDVDNRIIDIIQEMVDNYNNNNDLDKEHKELLWNKIIASLPSGFCLSATMTTNYRQIKTMCLQRKNHKLKEWKEFIHWAVTVLPKFSEMTGITE